MDGFFPVVLLRDPHADCGFTNHCQMFEIIKYNH